MHAWFLEIALVHVTSPYSHDFFDVIVYNGYYSSLTYERLVFR